MRKVNTNVAFASTNSVSIPLGPASVWDRSEAWLLFGALSGAVIIGSLLFNDVSFFSAPQTTNRGEPIATLASMNNAVRYRTADVPVWQPAARSMQIYRRDQIFTDANSRAEIRFKNNAGLVVDENSLVVIDLNEEKASLNLVRGSFTGKMSKNSGALNITVGNQTTQIVGSGAQISLSKTANEGLKLTVLEGKAQLLSGGQKLTLSKDQVGEVSKGDRRIRVQNLPITLLTPPRAQRILVKTEVPTSFSWRANIAGNHSYRFEIAADPGFTRLITATETPKTAAAVLNLTPGIYFWRVATKDPTSGQTVISEERRIEVVRISAPKLLNPSPDQVLTYRVTPQTRDGAHVALEWAADNSEFTVQIATDENFRNVVWQSRANDTRTLTKPLGKGQYHWRVRGIEAGATLTWSAPGHFTIRELGGLEPPTNLRVSNLKQLQNNPKTDRIDLAWDRVEGAKSYDIEVARDDLFSRQGKNAAMRKRISGTEFLWKSASRANFYWRVKAVDESGFSHDPSETQFVELKKRRAPVLPPPMPIVSSAPSPMYASNAPAAAPSGGPFGLTGPASMDDAIPSIKDDPKLLASIEPDVAEPTPAETELPVDLNAPTIISPTPGKRLTYLDEPIEVPFKWQDVDRATSYRFQLARNSDFSDLVMQQETAEATYPQPVEKGQYYWRVQALGPNNSQSAWSEPAQLAMRHIPPLLAPEVIVPQDQTKITYRTELPDVAYRWNELDKASSYELQVAKDSNYQNIAISETITDTRLVQKMAAGNYFWRVRGVEKNGRPGVWTESRRVEVARAASSPTVIAPKKGEVVKVFTEKGRKVKFAWDKIGDADTYKVVVSKDRSFNKIEYEKQTKKISEEISIKEDGEYYWYLEGRNNKESLAVRSEIESFKVEATEGSGANGMSSQRGRIYGGWSPMLYSYNASSNEGSYTLSKNILTGISLTGQMWFTRPIGAEFRFAQGSATFAAAQVGENFIDSTITSREVGLYGLLRYGLASAESLLGTNLIGRVGYLQTSYGAPAPDADNATYALTTTTSSHLTLGLGVDKDLSEKFMLASNIDYGLPMGGATPASSLGLNLELLQKISESGFLLGYGYRYLNTSGNYLVPATQTESPVKSSIHALRLSLGKGF